MNGLNEVAVIDVSTLQVTKQIPVGNAPWGVALDTTNNIVWVTNEGGLVPAGIPLNQLTTQQTASRTSKLPLAWQQESAKMFARPQKADSADPNILNHAN